MSAFEIAIPLIALAVAGVGTLVLRVETRAIDRRIAEEKQDKSGL